MGANVSSTEPSNLNDDATRLEYARNSSTTELEQVVWNDIITELAGLDRTTEQRNPHTQTQNTEIPQPQLRSHSPPVAEASFSVTQQRDTSTPIAGEEVTYVSWGGTRSPLKRTERQNVAKPILLPTQRFASASPMNEERVVHVKCAGASKRQERENDEGDVERVVKKSKVAGGSRRNSRKESISAIPPANLSNGIRSPRLGGGSGKKSWKERSTITPANHSYSLRSSTSGTARSRGKGGCMCCLNTGGTCYQCRNAIKETSNRAPGLTTPAETQLQRPQPADSRPSGSQAEADSAAQMTGVIQSLSVPSPPTEPVLLHSPAAPALPLGQYKAGVAAQSTGAIESLPAPSTSEEVSPHSASTLAPSPGHSEESVAAQSMETSGPPPAPNVSADSATTEPDSGHSPVPSPLQRPETALQSPNIPDSPIQSILERESGCMRCLDAGITCYECHTAQEATTNQGLDPIFLEMNSQSPIPNLPHSEASKNTDVFESLPASTSSPENPLSQLPGSPLSLATTTASFGHAETEVVAHSAHTFDTLPAPSSSSENEPIQPPGLPHPPAIPTLSEVIQHKLDYVYDPGVIYRQGYPYQLVYPPPEQRTESTQAMDTETTAPPDERPPSPSPTPPSPPTPRREHTPGPIGRQLRARIERARSSFTGSGSSDMEGASGLGLMNLTSSTSHRPQNSNVFPSTPVQGPSTSAYQPSAMSMLTPLPAGWRTPAPFARQLRARVRNAKSLGGLKAQKDTKLHQRDRNLRATKSLGASNIAKGPQVSARLALHSSMDVEGVERCVQAAPSSSSGNVAHLAASVGSEEFGCGGLAATVSEEGVHPVVQSTKSCSPGPSAKQLRARVRYGSGLSTSTLAGPLLPDMEGVDGDIPAPSSSGVEAQPLMFDERTSSSETLDGSGVAAIRSESAHGPAPVHRLRYGRNLSASTLVGPQVPESSTSGAGDGQDVPAPAAPSETEAQSPLLSSPTNITIRKWQARIEAASDLHSGSSLPSNLSQISPSFTTLDVNRTPTPTATSSCASPARSPPPVPLTTMGADSLGPLVRQLRASTADTRCEAPVRTLDTRPMMDVTGVSVPKSARWYASSELVGSERTSSQRGSEASRASTRSARSRRTSATDVVDESRSSEGDWGTLFVKQPDGPNIKYARSETSAGLSRSSGSWDTVREEKVQRLLSALEGRSFKRSSGSVSSQSDSRDGRSNAAVALGVPVAEERITSGRVVSLGEQGGPLWQLRQTAGPLEDSSTAPTGSTTGSDSTRMALFGNSARQLVSLGAERGPLWQLRKTPALPEAPPRAPTVQPSFPRAEMANSTRRASFQVEGALLLEAQTLIEDVSRIHAGKVQASPKATSASEPGTEVVDSTKLDHLTTSIHRMTEVLEAHSAAFIVLADEVRRDRELRNTTLYDKAMRASGVDAGMEEHRVYVKMEEEEELLDNFD